MEKIKNQATDHGCGHKLLSAECLSHARHGITCDYEVTNYSGIRIAVSLLCSANTNKKTAFNLT